MASATVHTVESLTTAVAGISHVLHRKVDGWRFVRIVVPGVPALNCRPGSRPNSPVPMHRRVEKRPRIIAPLGPVGGFLDAAGGGGRGPIVTSNLLIQGANPRKVIGTVNAADFFLTVTISATFVAALGWEAFTRQTVGMLIGGIAAAPLGGYIAKKIEADRISSWSGCCSRLPASTVSGAPSAERDPSPGPGPEE